MAPQPRIAPGTVTPVRRRGIRRRTTRSGAATGAGLTPTTVAGDTMSASYEHLTGRILGLCDGFALANGITAQQVVAGLKKSLTW